MCLSSKMKVEGGRRCESVQLSSKKKVDAAKVRACCRKRRWTLTKCVPEAAAGITFGLHSPSFRRQLHALATSTFISTAVGLRAGNFVVPTKCGKWFGELWPQNWQLCSANVVREVAWAGTAPTHFFIRHISLHKASH